MMISRIILNDFGNVIKLFVVLNLQTCFFDDLSLPKTLLFWRKGALTWMFSHHIW